MTRRRSAVSPGDVFNSWTVVGEMEPVPGSYALRRARCRCACGVEKPVRVDSLVGGRSRSCRRCASLRGRRTHGFAGGTRTERRTEYARWTMLLTRHRSEVDPRWLDFVEFVGDVCFAPRGFVASRPDRSRPWGPDNFAWIPLSEGCRAAVQARERKRRERATKKDATTSLSLGRVSLADIAWGRKLADRVGIRPGFVEPGFASYFAPGFAEAEA